MDVSGPGCGAHRYLSPTHAVSGFHLACIEEEEAGSSGGGGGVVSVTIFRDGRGEGNQTLALQTPPDSSSATSVLHVRHIVDKACYLWLPPEN